MMDGSVTKTENVHDATDRRLGFDTHPIQFLDDGLENTTIGRLHSNVPGWSPFDTPNPSKGGAAILVAVEHLDQMGQNLVPSQRNLGNLTSGTKHVDVLRLSHHYVSLVTWPLSLKPQIMTKRAGQPFAPF
jgi:hypothetical protein